MADAGEDSSRGRRGLIDVFLCSFLILVFLEAMPAWTLPQRVGQVLIQPLLVKSGLWQGTWQLFAPSPDKVNTFVTAEIILPSARCMTFGSQTGVR